MLREELNESLKQATKSKDSCAVATIRLILAALKDRDIAARSKGNNDGIGDDDILSLLQTMVKQRRESSDLYEKGNRPELAERELKEIEIIQSFMPEQMGDDDIAAAVAQVIEELGASGLKEMGGVMAALRERYQGQMDFGKASAVAKASLA
ncbi:MAG: glutamyl-tRNA amidotransferase [Rhodospirillaceae bacterium]|nr:glutamyl-tRNA amidotransferase [Rhodospirillaceae bacterium]|tara:strand:+ start:131 stop:586 length:456 start_codon:yes stop_codon:yes gene_type:complete